MTAAFVVLIGLVMFFGSTVFFRQTTQFILFFDQSVNGLNVGSQVKFRGVPIGKVDSIMIRVEGQDPKSTAIPVVVSVDRSRLERDFGVSESVFDPERIQASLARGLVGRLSLESFITGQLFVEFSFEPERARGRPLHLTQLNRVGGLIEIPTLPSSLDQITEDVARFLSHFGQLDLDEVVTNLNSVLMNLSVVLEGIDSEGMSVAVTRAADQITDFVGSQEIQATLEGLQATLATIHKTVETYDLNEGPLAARLEQWTGMLDASLGGFDTLVGDTGTLLRPGSDFRYELENTLRELSRAARSIRLFADYLEQHPNALLIGRPDEN